MNYTKMVKEFHKTFNAPVIETPQIPSKERCDLRTTLLQEELDEIKDAIQKKNIIDIADGFGDLMVILCGSILEFGLDDKFDEIFFEIHRSNMSKACSSEEEAQKTLEHYKQKDGTTGYYKKLDNRYVVYRDGDNKILKSINYSPANLKGIINK
jgi:predicted HAD superfamily Cof-like phosphohydrolase